MARIDQAAIAGGTPAIELMERAGQAFFDEINAWPPLKASGNARIVVLCGPGNNGGDGLVLSRLLMQSGALPRTVLCSSQRYSEDCLAQLARFVMSGGELLFLDQAPPSLQGFKHAVLSAKDLYYTIEQSQIVVDALLGTGQKGAPRGQAATLIAIVNQVRTSEENPPLVVSLDIPSGINAETGAVYDPGISADLTIAVEAFKRGMWQYPARASCGETSVVAIGLDPSCTAVEFSLLHPQVTRALLQRPGDFHKGRAGSVYVLGGSRCMPGAPVLAASAALHSGAGLVSMAALAGSRDIQIPPEIILDFPQATARDSFGLPAFKKIVKALDRCDCLLLGPGLGTSPASSGLVSSLVKWIGAQGYPAVIDADALNILAAHKRLPELPSCILTPHPGEMARLLQCDAASVQSDRFKAVRKLHEITGAICVLKGPGTLVYSQGRGFVNPTGGPFLATAGSGDVLCGMIAAFYSQLRQQPDAQLHASCAAVYAHGLCGQSWGPLTASDIIRNIPLELGALAGNRDA